MCGLGCPPGIGWLVVADMFMLVLALLVLGLWWKVEDDLEEETGLALLTA